MRLAHEAELGVYCALRQGRRYPDSVTGLRTKAVESPSRPYYWCQDRSRASTMEGPRSARSQPAGNRLILTTQIRATIAGYRAEDLTRGTAGTARRMSRSHIALAGIERRTYPLACTQAR